MGNAKEKEMEMSRYGCETPQQRVMHSDLMSDEHDWTLASFLLDETVRTVNDA